jgi:hypothetical protein
VDLRPCHIGRAGQRGIFRANLIGSVLGRPSSSVLLKTRRFLRSGSRLTHCGNGQFLELGPPWRQFPHRYKELLADTIVLELHHGRIRFVWGDDEGKGAVTLDAKAGRLD